MRTLAGWIERHADSAPSRTALRYGGEAISYAALAARIARLSHWLEDDCGLAPGARVAWLGHNHPDQLALLFACAHCSMVQVPLNWRLSSSELNQVLDDAGAALLVVDHSCAGIAGALDHPRIAAAGADLALPEDNHGHRLDPRDVDANLPVLLVYTSGTTGRAKGAVLSQQALLFNALNAIHMHDMSALDRVLTVLPLFHVGGLNIQSLPALYCGAELLLEPRFDPVVTLQRIANDAPTLTTLVPAMVDAMRNTPAWERADFGSLRCIATGSTDVPRAMIDAVHARGVPVIQIYGATETGPVAVYQRIDEACATAGSIGRAGLHTDVRLVDAEGADVDNGSVGELLLRGPHLASGYWNAERACVTPFENGWFASGDVARRDDKGLYWFTDRIKHVIISGGENIYPAELERILSASAIVREAAVAGRADEHWGEVPVVVAVRSAPEVDAATVLALFAEQIARYKRPRDVIFVDALPRNALGKVEVPRLRALVNAR